jgi:hypothetical protein
MFIGQKSFVELNLSQTGDSGTKIIPTKEKKGSMQQTKA